MLAANLVSAVSERLRNRGAGAAMPAPGAGIALLIAWSGLLGLCLLLTLTKAADGAVTLAAGGAGILLMAVTLAAGYRDRRAIRDARAITEAAAERMHAAETAHRIRAEELAAVLEASETLVFAGDTKLDFTAILAAITPRGATSLLVRYEAESDPAVVAAHGPLAPWFVGVSNVLRCRPGEAGSDAPTLTSYSSAGTVVGTAVSATDLAGPIDEVKAALGVRLIDHRARPLGRLHVIDPVGERVLEPAFVGLVQLAGKQIGVSMENQAVLVRAQRQLAEVQRMQAQLVRATKLGAVGELAAAVAHEVNNPLTGILGFAELLAAELPEGDPHREEAEVIRVEAVRARSIIRALVEFARPRPPQRIPSDVNELARTTVNLLRFRAAEPHVKISEKYGALPSLEIDPDAFGQVVLNLLNNAFDAMPGGGELELSTFVDGERIGIAIRDNGVGMDESTRTHVFIPFFSTKTGFAGGTGLGLSVGLQIVESHGGTIDLQSEPGRGATFTIWLPVSTPAFDGAVMAPALDGTAGSAGIAPGAVLGAVEKIAAAEVLATRNAMPLDTPDRTASGSAGRTRRTRVVV